MPRIPRGQQPGRIFHILNRGNGRARVFLDEHDYRRFFTLLAEAKDRESVDVYAACAMPNHFHVVARVPEPEAMSDMMQWFLTSHVRRHHKIYGTSGHLWQGRYMSVPIQDDEHLLTALRYVLLNPCRASLVEHPRDWPWSTLTFTGLVSPWPVSPPRSLDEWLRDPLAAEQLAEIRACVERGRPFGEPEWQRAVAEAGGLGSKLRPRGRPRIHPP